MNSIEKLPPQEVKDLLQMGDDVLQESLDSLDADEIEVLYLKFHTYGNRILHDVKTPESKKLCAEAGFPDDYNGALNKVSKSIKMIEEKISPERLKIIQEDHKSQHLYSVN